MFTKRLGVTPHPPTLTAFTYPVGHFVGVWEPMVIVEDHDCRDDTRGHHEHDAVEIGSCSCRCIVFVFTNWLFICICIFKWTLYLYLGKIKIVEQTLHAAFHNKRILGYTMSFYFSSFRKWHSKCLFTPLVLENSI